MLPTSARLAASSAVRVTVARGVRARSGDVSVSVLLSDAGAASGPETATATPPPAPVPARATVVVGRRAGNAVQRNRLRRRLRHALAPLYGELPPGARLVLRAGPSSHRSSPEQLRRQVAGAVRAGVHRAGTHEAVRAQVAHREGRT